MMMGVCHVTIKLPRMLSSHTACCEHPVGNTYVNKYTHIDPSELSMSEVN